MCRTAVILTNYNMPERSDAIARWLSENCENYDLYLVDNGSDLTPPAENTTVFLSENRQTTGGWLAGLEAADQSGQAYFAYWVMITSMRPISTGLDALAMMVEFMRTNPDVVGIHPALTTMSTTAWKHLITRNTWGPRRTWMIDNIAALWRADWFNDIGRFDPELVYAWGVDLETCYLARKAGKSLWVDDRVLIQKDTNIGYAMKRMKMDARERESQAYANMQMILCQKYGPDWNWKMREKNVEPEWR